MENFELAFSLGLFAVSIGFLWIYNKAWLIHQGITVEAEVVEMIVKRAQKGKMYKPRLIYTTQDQQEISYTPAMATSFPGVRVGDRVTVVYRPDNPGKATILKFRYTFGLSWGFTCVGAIVALFCWGVLYGHEWLEGLARSGGI